MRAREELGFKLAATPSAIDRLCEEVDRWLAECGLHGDRFAVAMLLRESLNNAMLHGCCMDAERQISCQLSFADDWLRIQVDDPGPGFDWIRERNCRRSETDCHGRGLLILEMYADDVRFNERGNGVVLRRRVTGGQ
ncbi:MAG: ATP-binding protein [Syntrophobacteraceae bacterium]|jgi:serine/threonine-protein kinase RsbW|nr:ATP-binding protein [Syntrophobacteraceae bacterium]